MESGSKKKNQGSDPKDGEDVDLRAQSGDAD